MSAKQELYKVFIKNLRRIAALGMVIAIFRLMVLIIANTSGSPECIIPSNITQNVSNLAKSSVAVYANGLYPSGPSPTTYGQWLPTGLYIDSSNTAIINVSGSVFMNSYNGNICVSNIISGYSSATTSPQPTNITNITKASSNPINSLPIFISSGDALTVSLLDTTTSRSECGSSYGTIAWGSSGLAGAAFSYSGTNWDSGGNNNYGQNGIGMGVGILADGAPSFTDINNKNLDYGSQTSTSIANFYEDGPTTNGFSGYGLTVAGAPSSGTLAFNIYNCGNCLTCNYNSCNYSCCDSPTQAPLPIAAVGSCPGTTHCPGTRTSCLSGNTCPNVNICCVDPRSAPAGLSSSTPVTYYSQNKGGYGFNVNLLNCESFGNNPVNCNAYPSPTNEGILQLAVATSDPNSNSYSPVNVTGTSINNNTYQYTYAPPSSVFGDIWYRIYDDNPGSYQNNTGQLIVDTTITSTPDNFLIGFVGPVITTIKTQLSAARMVIYENIAANSTFASIITLMINLYIAIYGVLFLAGLIKINFQDLVIRFIKIGVVLNFLFSDHGWSFFNNYIFNLFEQGGYFLSGLILQVPSNSLSDSSLAFENAIFAFINNTVGYAFNSQVWLMISALIGSGIGLIFALCIAYGIYILLQVVIEVIIAYIMAIIAFSLVISVAPIFIAFSLFDRTKSYFTNWYKQLFNLSLQPTMLFVTVLFFFTIFQEFLLSAINFSVCKTTYQIFGIFSLQDYQPINIAISSIIPAAFGMICLSKILSGTTGLASQITSSLTGSASGSIPLSGSGSVASKFMQKSSSIGAKTMGIDKDSRARRAYNKSKNNRSDANNHHEEQEHNNSHEGNPQNNHHENQVSTTANPLHEHPE